MSHSASEGTPGEARERPEFLAAFDELRRRPSASEILWQFRAHNRAERRVPSILGAERRRGDVALPAPVLDLELENPDDTDEVLERLEQRCGNHPVVRLGKSQRSNSSPEGTDGRG
ncbi:hypothetical protein FHX37_4399 [Haloactinospora alba]|uniref:Uncharacterized protein n=1 Tax=Haloactinospora alba TaxID=405555 RepID=A0A543N770_9ACTN|nr:hypothetical protein [Haloactinospora alba]TQN27674.1 hypothetical protein FHX37_4399 [Haloactinospora alba]